VPNRKLGERLSFEPPLSINALDDACLPYFYAGFYHQRAMLEKSRKTGLIFARDAGAITLCGIDAPKVLLKGERLDQAGELTLRFWLNGADAGCHAISAGEFVLVLEPASDVVREIPPGLFAHTVVEWQEEATVLKEGAMAEHNPRYGISSVEIL
jgi:hypothetical protein